MISIYLGFTHGQAPLQIWNQRWPSNRRHFDGTSQEIVDGYSGIFSQLRKTPKDIEEVASMREPLGLNMWGPPLIRWNDGL